MGHSLPERPYTTPTLTRGQVCDLLDMSEPTLAKRLPELQRLGFPGKIPGLNRWSRASVLHWINTSGGTYPGAAIEPVTITLVDDARSQLEREYAVAS